MKSELQELFQLAVKYFLKKYKKKGGAQSKLAEELGVTQSYLSSVTTGSRTASLDLYTKIAEKLYGPLDKFLAVGRRIKEGREPLEQDEKLPEDSVEHLIARLTYFVMDHQRIEKELTELKQFYENIVENQQSGILVMDKDHRVIYVNKHMQRISGITTEVILGTTPYQAGTQIPKLDISAFVERYNEAFKQRQSLSFRNIRTKMPNGEVLYISGWFTPIFKDGAYDGMICSVYDTTNSHILRKLLINTMNFSSHAIGVAQHFSPGQDPKVYYMNKKFSKIFGLEGIDPTTTPFAEVHRIMAANMKNSKKWLDHVKKSIASKTDTKITITMKNNKKYQWGGNPLIDDEGRYWGRIAIVDEIPQKGKKA